MIERILDAPPILTDADYEAAHLANNDLEHLESAAFTPPYRESIHFPLPAAQREANARALSQFRHHVTDSILNAYYLGRQAGEQSSNSTQGEQ